MSLSPQMMMSPEVLEWTYRGPFGGIQSELALDEIEAVKGFSFVSNWLFAQGKAFTLPEIVQITAPADGNSVVGIFDFFNSTGVLKSGYITTRNIYAFTDLAVNLNAPAIPNAGPALTGTARQQFSITTVANKLLFSQGIDKVQYWDGVAANFNVVSANAVPAYYLEEIGTHLVVAYTTEGGVVYPQRVRWTGANDPTDWISFNAGYQDILGNLGPITGLKKLREYGILLQFKGLQQVIPTGSGTAPFEFKAYGSMGTGCTIPQTVASFGQEGIAYANWGDILFFDGSSFESLANKPLDGNRRKGAKSAIFYDILNFLNGGWGNTALISSHAVYDFAGNKFKSYWLFLGGVTWVYHFDEDNWTRLNLGHNVTSVGNIYNNTPDDINHTLTTVARVLDLTGDSYTRKFFVDEPITVTSPYLPPPGIFLGVGAATYIFDILHVNTNGGATTPILTGPVTTLNDRVNTKNIIGAKFLVEVPVDATTQFTFTVKNEKAQSTTATITKTVALGGGRQYIPIYVPLTKLNGWAFDFELIQVGAPNNRIILREISLLYTIGSKYKGV